MQKREIIFQRVLHSCPFSLLDFLLKQNGPDKRVMLDKTTSCRDWALSLHVKGAGGVQRALSELQRQSQRPPGCLWRGGSSISGRRRNK